MEYKYASNNALDNISLHDCVIEKVEITDAKLILEFDHLDVLPEHPLNNYANAKYTSTAALIFEDFEVIQSLLYDTSKIDKKHIIAEQDACKMTLDIKDLAEEFEVLEVKKKPEQEHYSVYEFNGIASYKYRSDFGVFILKCRNVEVCWNELIDDSWFVNK